MDSSLIKKIFLICLSLNCFVVFSFAATCQSPRVTASGYSTQDAFFHQSTAFVADFILKCQNDAKDLQLYAEINGKLLPVAHAQDSGRYVVSWTEEHDKAPGGEYVVNVMDEEGFSAIKKALRNNEDISKLAPLFKISINHPGPAKGAFISSEVVAMALSVSVLYLAYSWKAALQS